MVVLEGGAVRRKARYQNRTSANNREEVGSKFWSFCKNVIIECPFGLVWLAKESLDSLISRGSQSHGLKCCSYELKTDL